MFGVIKILLCFWKKYFRLTGVAFIYKKYSKTSNIVKYFHNLK